METFIVLVIIIVGAACYSWLYGYMDDRLEVKIKARDKLAEQNIGSRMSKMKTLEKIDNIQTMGEWKAFSQNALDETLEDLNQYSNKSSPNYQLLLESYYKMKEIHDRIFNLQ